MTSHTRADVVARRSALTLRERLSSRAHPDRGTPPGVGDQDDVIDRWRRVLDRAGTGRFARRLHWDGLDEAGVRATLRVPLELSSSDEWTTIWTGASADAEQTADCADRVFDPCDPQPFEEILVPFVRDARRRLRDRLPSIDTGFAPNAVLALERALLAELCGVAEQALFAEFAVARARQGGGLSLGDPARRIYLDFVRRMRSAGLVPIVERYPVLARLLVVRTELWVQSSVELAMRARADAAAIGDMFAGGPPGPITDIRVGRGDTHAGGRTVAQIAFESGLTVMYKPRPMQIDVAFYALTAWLHGVGLEPQQRAPLILDRGDYGWMEFLRPAPVDSATQLRTYYERAGTLLCLGYVLGAGDLHAENIIAAGEYPVLVDLEMLMCSPVDAAGTTRDPAPDGAYATNVLGSLLLPFWNVGPGGVLIFRGGGLGAEHAALRSSEWQWTFVNTDRMARAQRNVPLPAPTNMPMIDGRPAPPEAHVEDIVRGFERCHALLESRRAELAAAGGPFDRFRGLRVRVMVRDTRVYGTVLRNSLHPRQLEDGVERSLQLEILRLSVLGSDRRVSHWPAFDAEQGDLEKLDYPVFWAHTDSTVLHDARGAAVGTYCAVSAYDQALDRMRRLDATDRDHQTSLIRFIYSYARAPRATAGARPASSAADALDATTAVDEARAIAAALEALIVTDADGGLNWVGVDREQKAPALGVKKLRDRLYDGRAGVALFFATLDSVAATGHLELASGALQPLRRLLRDPRARSALPDAIGLGAGLGVGGLTYTLAHLARLTQDARWSDDACHAARSITRAQIEADTVLEVLGGVAGAALALLSLHALTGDRWLVDRAIACGRRLVAASATEPVTGKRVWRLASGQWGTGFAHGAGGIAAALQRLTAVTGDEAFAAAAAEALSFEDTVANLRSNVTPALEHAVAKTDDQSPWKQTWCNGGVGVALGSAIHGARAGGDVVSASARVGLASYPDHVCCGTMGRVELLLAAGHGAEAWALAGKVLARARAGGSYYISRDVPDARYAPAFFQGLSGIGYQLLRLARPSLPSVLAYQ